MVKQCLGALFVIEFEIVEEIYLRDGEVEQGSGESLHFHKPLLQREFTAFYGHERKGWLE